MASLYREIARDAFSQVRNRKYCIDPGVFKKVWADPGLEELTTSGEESLDFTGAAALEVSVRVAEIIVGNPRPSGPSWFQEMRDRIYNTMVRRIFDDIPGPFVEEKLEETILCVFTEIYPFFFRRRQASGGSEWVSRYRFEPVGGKYLETSRIRDEYKSFLRAFSDDRILEAMMLSQEWKGFTTLDHVLGVHMIAVEVGKQLHDLGIPIDLPLLSGAAAGHDIGKFGCRGEELKRVPYLHYYYTKVWYDRHALPRLSHVATNHSTWDLEMVRMPIESLLLIYADFRVKIYKFPDGASRMHIFTPSDSFEVIKSMLDNLDEAKLRRYRGVFQLLGDLQDLLEVLGVETNPHCEKSQGSEESTTTSDIASAAVSFRSACRPLDLVSGAVNGDIFGFLGPAEVSPAAHLLATVQNIHMMNFIKDVSSLNRVFEEARLQKNWRDFRAYLRALEIYHPYFTIEQKEATVEFLMEQLHHEEDDVRYYAAELTGIVISNMEERFLKELPARTHVNRRDHATGPMRKILSLLDVPVLHSEDQRVLYEQIVYMVPVILGNLFFNVNDEEKLRIFKTSLLYKWESTAENPVARCYLMESLKTTVEWFDSVELEEMFRDAAGVMVPGLYAKAAGPIEISLRISALTLVAAIARKLKDIPAGWTVGPSLMKAFFDNFDNLTDAEIYLCRVLCNTAPGFLPAAEEIPDKALKKGRKSGKALAAMIEKKWNSLRDERLQEIYLQDFKTNIPWFRKRINCNLLLAIVRETSKGVRGGPLAMEVAGHCCNLLKVSLVEGTRFSAGMVLLETLAFLSDHQKNEIAIELLRSLEQDLEGFTQYMPRFLAKIIMSLPEMEFNEVIEDMELRLQKGYGTLKELFLQTVGFMFPHLDLAGQRRGEVLNRLLKLTTGCLIDTHPGTRKMAYNILGRRLFGSVNVSDADKNEAFKVWAKKIMSLLSHRPGDRVHFFHLASFYNYMYRFLLKWQLDNGPIIPEIPSKVFFHPGTFDPFSAGHEELTRIAASRGGEVFIQIDEFSWSKRTLPRNIRKTIVRMAMAEDSNVYLLPFEPPLNIASKADVEKLGACFPGREIWVLAGADVILNASAYAEGTASGIRDFNHLVFSRDPLACGLAGELDELFQTDGRKKTFHQISRLRKAFKSMKGTMEFVTLPENLSSISSTIIRRYLDSRIPISGLVSPRAEEFIKKFGLYLKEPSEKGSPGRLKRAYTVKDIDEVTVQDIEDMTDLYMDSFRYHVTRRLESRDEARESILSMLRRVNARVIFMENSLQGNERIAYLIYHEVPTDRIFSFVGNVEVAKYIRDNSSGNVVFSRLIVTKSHYAADNLIQDIKRFAVRKWVEDGYFYAFTWVNLTLKSRNRDDKVREDRLRETNGRLGYRLIAPRSTIEIGGGSYEIGYLFIDLRKPVLFIQDLEEKIKPPFNRIRSILDSIHENRKTFIDQLKELYPGNVILPITNRDLIQRISELVIARFVAPELEGIPRLPGRRHLARPMFVSCNRILGRDLIPGVVNKALHIEWVVNRFGQHSGYRNSPHFAPVSEQIAVIKAFGRPVILGDLVGYSHERLQFVSTMARKAGIEIMSVVAAIMSGEVKDQLEATGMKTDCAIYIPRVRAIFNESLYYPFVNGEPLLDTFEGQDYMYGQIYESLNPIYPYRRPEDLEGFDYAKFVTFSMNCIASSLNFFRVVEKEYLADQRKELVLRDIHQVIDSPRIPLGNILTAGLLDQSIANLVSRDLEHIMRLL